MRSRKNLVVAVLVLTLLAVATVMAACGGETTTTQATATTVLPVATTRAVTTTAAVSTTQAVTTTAAELDQIASALQQSGKVAVDFQITGYLIQGDWAGVIVSAPMVDNASVLLKRSAAGWKVVTLGSDLSSEDLLGYGAPAEIADLLGYASPAATAQLSSESIVYAESLGGTSHVGETLYFVIGASVETEGEAQVLLEDAIPKFGDMQSYFIVQRSDNFEGMNPGWWVVFEAYRSEPAAENIEFGRRGFPQAYVKQATVNTSDPIPVYEDMTGQ